MTAIYEVRLYNTDGQMIALLDDWRSLTVEHRLNSFSTHQLSLDAKDPRAHLFQLDCFVEVLRSDPANNLSMYREYIGFHRTPQFSISADGYYIFTSYGRSLEDLLNRRSLLYRAPYEKSGAADDVMKGFVRENAGSQATVANGRIVDGTFIGFSVAANNGLAGTWQGQRSWRNLLDVVREISLANAVDFNVEYVAPAQFEFRTYYPQKGVDRTLTTGVVPHVFSAENGNARVPTYVHSRTEEITVVAIMGSGEEAARVVRVVEDTDHVTHSPWNRIELARDARNETTNAALDAVGRSELERLITDENFTFEVLETPASVYGRDYRLGDLVTTLLRVVDSNDVAYQFQIDKKIVELSFTVAEDGESIRVRTGDLVSLGTGSIRDLEIVFHNIIRRLQVVENSGTI